MHEAKTQLSRLVERTLAGEEVILTHGRKRIPVARIVPFEEGLPAGEVRSLPAFASGKRPIGLYAGQFEIGSEAQLFPDGNLRVWEDDEADARD